MVRAKFTLNGGTVKNGNGEKMSGLQRDETRKKVFLVSKIVTKVGGRAIVKTMPRPYPTLGNR